MCHGGFQSGVPIFGGRPGLRLGVADAAISRPSAERVAALFPGTRRQTDLRFRRAIGRTIAEEIRVVELMIENENWSYRKAMMKYIGLDCGSYRHPYAPLTDAEYAAFAKRIDTLGILQKA